MKQLRRFCAIALLTLTLALPALADGQMNFPIAPPPPPPPVADGQMNFPVTGAASNQETEAAAIDPLTEIVLTLVQNVLSLF